MTAVSQTANRELSPTEKKIQELKESTARQVAELRATGTITDIVTYVMSVKKLEDIDKKKLYSLVKPFTNSYETEMRADPNYVPKKRGAKAK